MSADVERCQRTPIREVRGSADERIEVAEMAVPQVRVMLASAVERVLVEDERLPRSGAGSATYWPGSTTACNL
jgi:hypothetical protein